MMSSAELNYDAWKTSPPEYDDVEGSIAFKCSCCMDYVRIGEKYFTPENTKETNFGRLCANCCEVKHETHKCLICGEESEVMFIVEDEHWICPDCVYEYECDVDDIDILLDDDGFDD